MEHVWRQGVCWLDWGVGACVAAGGMLARLESKGVKGGGGAAEIPGMLQV